MFKQPPCRRYTPTPRNARDICRDAVAIECPEPDRSDDWFTAIVLALGVLLFVSYAAGWLQ